MRVFSVSLPPVAAEVLVQAAERAGLAPDELICEALRRSPEFQMAMQRSGWPELIETVSKENSNG